MTDFQGHSLERGCASDGRVSWAIPVSSRPYPSLSSVPPSRPSSRRAMSGISLDGTCLKISSIINPQPGPRHKHPGRADECSNDQHSLSCFLSSHSLDRGPVCVRAGMSCPDCPASQTAYPSHQSASGNVGLGGNSHSASSETSTRFLWCARTGQVHTLAPGAAKSDRR